MSAVSQQIQFLDDAVFNTGTEGAINGSEAVSGDENAAIRCLLAELTWGLLQLAASGWGPELR
jgi:hypothetical protein